jgi:hypothetical protein
MASTGHTSKQARHSVQRVGSTLGRRGAGDRAVSGQVTMQAPHAVHFGPTSTVTLGPPSRSPAG